MKFLHHMQLKAFDKEGYLMAELEMYVEAQNISLHLLLFKTTWESNQAARINLDITLPLFKAKGEIHDYIRR